MGKSKCCQSETRIGYYNMSQRPDIHGIVTENNASFTAMGTYCLKCGKLCDYISGKFEYYTNGIIKNNT